MKFWKTVFWVVLGFGLMFIFYRWYRCNKKGEETGEIFRCPFLCSEPKMLEVQDVFHQMLEGKCYEKEMTYRRVELEQCGEKPAAMKSESLAEYEIID
jgi:hypothetical protein